MVQEEGENPRVSTDQDGLSQTGRGDGLNPSIGCENFRNHRKKERAGSSYSVQEFVGRS